MGETEDASGIPSSIKLLPICQRVRNKAEKRRSGQITVLLGYGRLRVSRHRHLGLKDTLVSQTQQILSERLISYLSFHLVQAAR
ncbi:uncharacterized [Tachysurus ichikawai]